MDIYLLDKNLNKIHVVDNYKSLIWAARYNDLGDCELMISASKENINKISQSYYITRDDDDMICQIVKIELTTDTENGDYLIVSGIDMKKLANQRIVWKQINFNGYVEDYIRKLLTENAINPSIANRKIPNLILDDKVNFTEKIKQQITYTNIGERIQELCKTYSWGYKIYVNDDLKKFVFKLYQGTDRSDYVIFSDDYENLSSTKFVDDSSDISTIALVAGEGEGTDREKQEVETSSSTGIDRYEIYVDARDISKTIQYDELIIAYPNGTQVEIGDITYYQVDGVNIAELTIKDGEVTEAKLTSNIYTESLVSRGLENLAEHRRTKSFEGSIEPTQTFVYKRDYFLGDVVTVENKYGISAEARIVEVIEVDDDNGYSIEPKFEYIQTQEIVPTQVIEYLSTENNEIISTENNKKIISKIEVIEDGD